MRWSEHFHVIQAKENKLQLWLHPQTQHFALLSLLSVHLVSVVLAVALCGSQHRVSLVSSSLQKYVREQILLAVAVIVKRGSLDKSINCKSIFHEVGQLISSGNPTVVRDMHVFYRLTCVQSQCADWKNGRFIWIFPFFMLLRDKLIHHDVFQCHIWICYWKVALLIQIFKNSHHVLLTTLYLVWPC